MAAERALRGFALGRRSWLFAGSERGAERAASVATLIATAKLNEVDRRPGSPTSSRVSMPIRLAPSPIFSPGIGKPRKPASPQPRSIARAHHAALQAALT